MLLKMLANIITSLRIGGTAALLFITPMSKPFYVVYTLCGATDIIDGVVARATKTTSELGAKLDSIADILFYAVMLFRIFPILAKVFPWWMWVCILLAVLLRVVSYLVAALKYRRFASIHTYMNKVTGAAVFTVPYFIRSALAIPFSVLVCVIAGVSSLEELIIHLKNKEYSTKHKTLLPLNSSEAKEA